MAKDELLSAYLDGELSGEEQAQIEQWLATDPEARQLLDELRAVGATLQGLPQEKLDEDLGPRVLRTAERRMLSPPDPASTAAESSRSAPFRATQDADGSPTAEPVDPPLPSIWREIDWRGLVSRRALFWSGLAVAIAMVIRFTEPPAKKGVADAPMIAMGENGRDQPEKPAAVAERQQVSFDKKPLKGLGASDGMSPEAGRKWPEREFRGVAQVPSMQAPGWRDAQRGAEKPSGSGGVDGLAMNPAPGSKTRAPNANRPVDGDEAKSEVKLGRTEEAAASLAELKADTATDSAAMPKPAMRPADTSTASAPLGKISDESAMNPSDPAGGRRTLEREMAEAAGQAKLSESAKAKDAKSSRAPEPDHLARSDKPLDQPVSAPASAPADHADLKMGGGGYGGTAGAQPQAYGLRTGSAAGSKAEPTVKLPSNMGDEIATPQLRASAAPAEPAPAGAGATPVTVLAMNTDSTKDRSPAKDSLDFGRTANADSSGIESNYRRIEPSAEDTSNYSVQGFESTVMGKKATNRKREQPVAAGGGDQRASASESNPRVVYLDVAPETARGNSFEEVLTRNGISPRANAADKAKAPGAGGKIITKDAEQVAARLAYHDGASTGGSSMAAGENSHGASYSATIRERLATSGGSISKSDWVSNGTAINGGTLATEGALLGARNSEGRGSGQPMNQMGSEAAYAVQAAGLQDLAQSPWFYKYEVQATPAQIHAVLDEVSRTPQVFFYQASPPLTNMPPREFSLQISSSAASNSTSLQKQMEPLARPVRPERVVFVLRVVNRAPNTAAAVAAPPSEPLSKKPAGPPVLVTNPAAASPAAMPAPAAAPASPAQK